MVAGVPDLPPSLCERRRHSAGRLQRQGTLDPPKTDTTMDGCTQSVVELGLLRSNVDGRWWCLAALIGEALIGALRARVQVLDWDTAKYTRIC